MSDTTASNNKKGGKRLRIHDIVILGFMGAIMFGSQAAIAVLPNIEAVTMLVMACTIVFGLRALYPVYIFVALEILLYGANIWVINYLYVWALLLAVTLLLRRTGSYVLWAAVAGGFGLLFGALCSIPYFFIGGAHMALAYWIGGIPFDLIHCVSNVIISAFVLKPVVKLLRHLTEKAGTS